MRTGGGGRRRLTGAIGHGDGDVGLHERLAPRGDLGVTGGVQVVAGGEGAATRRQPCLGRELLDQQRWARRRRGGHGCGVGVGRAVRRLGTFGQRRRRRRGRGRGCGRAAGLARHGGLQEERVACRWERRVVYPPGSYSRSLDGADCHKV